MADPTAVESGHGDAHEHASRWPLVTAVGAGALYLGAGLGFVGADLVPVAMPVALVGLGVAGVLAGLAGWATEAFLGRRARSTPPDGGPYVAGMVLFLVSDVATFAGGFVYYAFVRVGAWPPSELPPLLGSLVAVNTVVLVASSATLHSAHAALDAGARRRFLALLGTTLGLGVVFLGGQVLEYREFLIEGGFSLSSGAFASAFFGLTGLHGLHVALGVVLLAVAFGRALRGAHGPERDTSIRTTSLYWHFVDAVWLLLVAVLYVGAAV